MPSLDWIGKKAVVNHHKQVPFHLLRQNMELSAGDPDSKNLLVQGDNLVALKALLPYYAGQVKCIYIDPPYNTGNESWVYNDNVNSPEMRAWLGDVVVNSSLFDVLMVSFLAYDKNLIMRNLDAIREAIISLMTENQEFIDSIEKWTYAHDQVKRRFEIFNQAISSILRSDNTQERLFSHELKENLFKLNNSCAICGQKIYMIEDSAVDHIEQYWLVGKTIPSNSRLTHRYCNASRKRKERD